MNASVDNSLPTRIVLIGYRGTGKTSVGRLLAAEIGYECFDADVELEHAAGITIKSIFEREGEAGFRDRETAVLANLCQRDRVVLALGGGAILREENRSMICDENNRVIWLQASADTLYQRIHGDQTTSARRPNLTAAGGREEIVALLAKRESFYRQCADWEIDTEAKALDEVVEEIKRKLG